MCRLLVFSAALGFLYLLFSTLEHLLVVVGHLGHETLVAGDIWVHANFLWAKIHVLNLRGRVGSAASLWNHLSLAVFFHNRKSSTRQPMKTRRLISFDGILSSSLV
jgi:hypothetical protein